MEEWTHQLPKEFLVHSEGRYEDHSVYRRAKRAQGVYRNDKPIQTTLEEHFRNGVPAYYLMEDENCLQTQTGIFGWNFQDFNDTTPNPLKSPPQISQHVDTGSDSQAR